MNATNKFHSDLKEIFLPIIDYVTTRPAINQLNDNFFNRAVEQLKNEMNIQSSQELFSPDDTLVSTFSRLFHTSKLDHVANALSKMKEEVTDPQMFAFMESLINSNSTTLSEVQENYNFAMHNRYILGTGVTAVVANDIIYNNKNTSKTNPYIMLEIISKIKNMTSNQGLLDLTEQEKMNLDLIKEKLTNSQKDLGDVDEIIQKKETLDMFLKTDSITERSVLRFIEAHDKELGAEEIAYLLSKGTFRQMFGSYGLINMLPNKVDRLEEAVIKWDLAPDFIKTGHISPITSSENKMEMLFLGVIEVVPNITINADGHIKQITQYLTGTYLANKYESELDAKKQELLRMYGGCADNHKNKAFQFIDALSKKIPQSPKDRVENLIEIKKKLREFNIPCRNELLNKSDALKVTSTGEIYYRETDSDQNQIFSQFDYLQAMRDGILSLQSMPNYSKTLPTSFIFNGDEITVKNITPNDDKNLPGGR